MFQVGRNIGTKIGKPAQTVDISTSGHRDRYCSIWTDDENDEGTVTSKLDGKVAIITGAARGLGRAYAKRLAGLGAKIAVADLNLRSYEEFEIEARDMCIRATPSRRS